jgi:site-specific recombinase XerD
MKRKLSPLKGRPSPMKGKRLPPEVLTREEIMLLLAACSRRGSSGVRNHALIVTCWRAGLRIAEALALRPADVNTETGVLSIRHGKGDRSRTVALDAHACAVIDAWIERRARLGINGRSTLFCTLKGTPLSSAYVRTALARLGRRASLEKRVHAHGLRHAFASELASEGIELRIIQALLGHANASTTDRYLARINPVAAIATVRARPDWKGGRTQ